MRIDAMGKAQLGVMDESDWWTGGNGRGVVEHSDIPWRRSGCFPGEEFGGLWVVHGFSFSGLQARLHLFLCRRNCPIITLAKYIPR